VDKGRNAGVTGIVDCVINGVTVNFGMQVYIWDEDTAVSTVENTGQGSNDLGASLNLIENGNVLLRGKVRKDLIPFPNALKDAQGTVTFTLSKGIPGGGQADVNMVATYRFNQVKVHYDDPKETMWDMTIGGPRVSALVASGFANNASSSTLTPNGSGNTYLYSGRQKLYDPNALVNTSDQPFNFWGLSADTDAAELTALGQMLAYWVTPPQASQKVHSVSVERLSSVVMRVRVHWGMLNTADEIIVPRTNSVRSYTEAFTDEQAFLVATNGTMTTAALANQIANSSQGVNYLASIIAQLRTPNINFVVAKYYNPGQLWRGSTKSGARQVKAQMSGSNAQLYVDRVVQYTTGSNPRGLIYLGIVDDYSVVIRDFMLFRMFTCTTIPEFGTVTVNGVSKTLPQLGQMNSGTWQGLAAGTVVYQGAQFKVKIDQLTNGALTMLMGYKFHVNTYGIINGVPTSYIRRAYMRQFSGSFPSDQSWVNASTLGFPNVTQPTSASFTDFTS